MAVFNKVKFVYAIVCAVSSLMASEMSLDECREKVATGDAEAQWQLGQRYEEGRGVGKSVIRAVIQYKKAAEQKHRKACARLSELYSRGEFVKKDAMLAAKYRALASGENAESATVESDKVTSTAEERIDEIEVDWILGRNGKRKDPKIGIRILYDAAKEKPIAKAVFVKRWQKGDLDNALSVLTEEEWELIVPWFREAFAAGWKKAGLIVGNAELYKKNYMVAADHYLAAGRAGLPKAWYYLGLLYWTCSDETQWGMPEYMKSDYKAMEAFKNTLRQDPGYVSAKWDLGRLYLFSKDKKCSDSLKAFQIFSDFYKRDKANKLKMYFYGLSGWFKCLDEYGQKKDLFEKAARVSKGAIDYSTHRKRLQEEREIRRQAGEFLDIIKQAADMGCEPARNFMEQFEKDTSQVER